MVVVASLEMPSNGRRRLLNAQSNVGATGNRKTDGEKGRNHRSATFVTRSLVLIHQADGGRTALCVCVHSVASRRGEKAKEGDKDNELLLLLHRVVMQSSWSTAKSCYGRLTESTNESIGIGQDITRPTSDTHRSVDGKSNDARYVRSVAHRRLMDRVGGGRQSN